jgi:hypothetical protein
MKFVIGTVAVLVLLFMSGSFVVVAGALMAPQVLTARVN